MKITLGILKTILPISTATLIVGGIASIALSSCTDSYVGNLDGSNWKGWKHGSLEIQIDYMYKTATINRNLNYEAENLSIPARISADGTNFLNVISIGDNAFKDANITGKLTIPNSITNIGRDCFAGVKITDISFYANNTYGFATNVGKAKILVKKTADLKAELDYTKQDLIGCLAVGVLTIPNNIWDIADASFWGCASLTAVNFSDELTDIGKQAFQGCASLTAVNFPDKLTHIGNQAFDGCTSLTGTLTFPESVSTIGNQAFHGCSGIIELNLENFTGTYGDIFLKGCTSLQTVYISTKTTHVKTGSNTEGWDNVGPESCTLYAPDFDTAANFKSGVIVGTNFTIPDANKWVYQQTPTI